MYHIGWSSELFCAVLYMTVVHNHKHTNILYALIT